MEHLVFLTDGETHTSIGELDNPATIVIVEKVQKNDVKIRVYSLPILLASLRQFQWDMAEIEMTEKQSKLLLP